MLDKKICQQCKHYKTGDDFFSHGDWFEINDDEKFFKTNDDENFIEFHGSPKRRRVGCSFDLNFKEHDIWTCALNNPKDAFDPEIYSFELRGAKSKLPENCLYFLEHLVQTQKKD